MARLRPCYPLVSILSAHYLAPIYNTPVGTQNRIPLLSVAQPQKQTSVQYHLSVKLVVFKVVIITNSVHCLKNERKFSKNAIQCIVFTNICIMYNRKYTKNAVQCIDFTIQCIYRAKI